MENIKRVAALLLLIATLLPIAQCSMREKVPVPSSNRVTKVIVQSKERPVYPEMASPIYVWQQFELSKSNSWIFALAFVWPIPLLFARWKLPFRLIRPTTYLLEVPLCAFTAYLLFCYLRDPHWRLLSGGYIAAIGTLLYSSAVFAEVFYWLRKRYCSRSYP